MYPGCRKAELQKERTNTAKIQFNNLFGYTELVQSLLLSRDRQWMCHWCELTGSACCVANVNCGTPRASATEFQQLRTWGVLRPQAAGFQSDRIWVKLVNVAISSVVCSTQYIFSIKNLSTADFKNSFNSLIRFNNNTIHMIVFGWLSVGSCEFG